MTKNGKIFTTVIILVLLIGAGFFLFSSKNKENVEKVGETTVNNPSDSVLFDKEGFGFTFEYPKNFSSTTEDLGNEIKRVVFDGNEPKKSFQITSIPFDEAGPLTEVRIKQDLPDLVMKNVSNIDVGGVQAVSFSSVDSELGNTFEVWFVSGVSLIQVQTYDEFKGSLLEIFKTWKNK